MTTGRPTRAASGSWNATSCQPRRRREHHAGAGGVDHPRHDDAHSLAAAGLRVTVQRLPDPHRELDDEAVRVPLRGEARHADERLAHDVGDHEERPRGPQVDRHDAAPPRVEVQERGLAAPGRLPGGPLVDAALAMRSFTSPVTAPRLVLMRRARSALEMGCRVRTRLRAIWRLISREVPRRPPEGWARSSSLRLRQFVHCQD